MLVTTTRFGELEHVEVSDDELFEIDPGLRGFEQHHRFARIVDDESPIEWLQSLDEPRLVFALLEPFLFYPDYGFELPEPDSEALGIVRPEDAIVRCVLTLHDGVEETTANMVAPLVLNQATGRGRQVVLQDANLPLRFAVFESLRLAATA
jgi:flagellar assembly factor FliW